MASDAASSTVERSIRACILSRRAGFMPEAGRVAFDDLAERVAEPRRRTFCPTTRPLVLVAKQPLADGPTCPPIGVDDLERQPDRALVHEIAALDPKHRRAPVELRSGDSRQALEVDEFEPGLQIGALAKCSGRAMFSACQVSTASMSPRLSRRRCRALAVEHRARPGIRPADHDDWYARPVEPGEIGDPGDPEGAPQRDGAGDHVVNHRIFGLPAMNRRLLRQRKGGVQSSNRAAQCPADSAIADPSPDASTSSTGEESTRGAPSGPLVSGRNTVY